MTNANTLTPVQMSPRSSGKWSAGNSVLKMRVAIPENFFLFVTKRPIAALAQLQ
jgi:hypothetical protein